MLSIGLHCRLAGRPARIAALARFLDHVQKHDKAGSAGRVEIARHWAEHHAVGAGVTIFDPANRCDGARRRSSRNWWHLRAIRPGAGARVAGRPFRSRDALHAAMEKNRCGRQPRRTTGVIRGHPELAGRLALDGR